MRIRKGLANAVHPQPTGAGGIVKPRTLTPAESAIWDRIMERLQAASGMVCSLDAAGLEKIVHLEAQYEANREQLAQSGLLYKDPSGRVVKSPRLVIQESLVSQLFDLYRSYGLTPESRMRIGVKGRDKASKMAQLLALPRKDQ